MVLGARKMPLPMVMETIAAASDQVPSARTRAGREAGSLDEMGEVTALRSCAGTRCARCWFLRRNSSHPQRRKRETGLPPRGSNPVSPFPVMALAALYKDRFIYFPFFLWNSA